jgi:hypothetical protein
VEIRLHIERLVLEGLSLEGRDPAQIQTAVAAELSRLLIAGGLAPDLAAGAARASLDGGQIGGQGGASALGGQIAGAVYSALGGAQEGQR